MNFYNLISLNYWFSLQTPEMNKTSLIVSSLVFLGVIAVAIFLKIISKRLRQNPPLSHFLRRLANPFIFLGILGYIFLFFREETIYFLGARFWFIFLGLIFLVWIGVLTVRFLKTYKRDLARIEKEREFRKYLT